MHRSPRRRPSAGAARPLDREIYRLQLVYEKADGIACLHVQASMSLSGLHAEIATRTGYPVEVPYEFKVPQREGEEVIFGSEPGAVNPGALLGGLGLVEGSSFEYACELPDRTWVLHIAVTEVLEAEDGVSYPEEGFWDLTTTLRAPADEGDEEDEEVGPEIPLDADLMDIERMIFEALEEHHYEHDGEKPNPHLTGHVQLAMRVLELTAPRPLQFEALCQALDEPLDEWIWTLGDRLVDQKRLDEFVALLDAMSKLEEVFEELRPSRVLAFVGQGRREEALALIDELEGEIDQPDGEDPVSAILGSLIELGELTRAEALAQRLRGSKDLEIQFSALDALVTLYKRSGRKREARIAETQLARIVEIWSAEMDEEESGDPLGSEPRPAPIETVRREGPKVGRNDPCPCQSGKKYKKCCGA